MKISKLSRAGASDHAMGLGLIGFHVFIPDCLHFCPEEEEEEIHLSTTVKSHFTSMGIYDKRPEIRILDVSFPMPL